MCSGESGDDHDDELELEGLFVLPLKDDQEALSPSELGLVFSLSFLQLSGIKKTFEVIVADEFDGRKIKCH